MNSIPYIVGPFTPEQVELLKRNPTNPLEAPAQIVEDIRKEFQKMQVLEL